MHPNPAFRRTPETRALDLAAARGFGILTVNGPEAPLSAHVPFVLAPDRRILRAHLVRSNPLMRRLEDGPMPALVSISGPDGYVSPDWYDLPQQVPTWNYVAVNLRGRLRALPQEALEGLLAAQSAHFEAALVPKPAWTMDKLDEDVAARMMRQIRPVEMRIDKAESTFKLGQNKPATARVAAAGHMAAGRGPGQELAALAALMAAAEAPGD